MAKVRKGKRKVKALAVEDDEAWRANVIIKLNDILDDDRLASQIEQALYDHVDARTEITERAMFQDKLFKQRYHYKLTSLVMNLDPNSPIKNKNLLKKVVSGELSPHQLVEASPIELFPEKWEDIKKKQSEEEKFLYEDQRKATSKRIKCSKCKQNKVTYFEAQTRSADEPMTIFYECLECGNKWRG